MICLKKEPLLRRFSAYVAKALYRYLSDFQLELLNGSIVINFNFFHSRTELIQFVLKTFITSLNELDRIDR